MTRGPSRVPDRSGRVRAGDADRTRVTSLLAEHYAQGRLDYAEFDERSSQALAAVYLDELDALLADLPGALSAPRPPMRPRPPSTAPAGRDGPWVLALLLAGVALVILTRGAALWLLLALWWIGRPAMVRRNSRSLPRATYQRDPTPWMGPSPWMTGPSCRRRWAQGC